MPPKGNTKCIKPRQRELIDRISYLPDVIIDLILSRIPLRDAVRTSSLSSNWRLHWTRIESLELDYDFFCRIEDRNLEGEQRASSYKDTVGSILSSLCGPIRKFFLCINNDDEDFPSHEGFGQWILSASQHGLQDLTLVAECFDTGYQGFPSSVFQCVELKRFSVSFFALDEEFLPHNFRKLSSLVSLELCCVRGSGGNLTNIISNCPLLESLQLDVEDCNPLTISTPTLKLLSIKYYGDIDFILKDTPNISTLSLMENLTEEIKPTVRCQDIVEFFGAILNVENTNLHSTVLDGLSVHGVPERLPALLVKHSSLTICNLGLLSMPQVLTMFCLIKSSPRLHKLDISAANMWYDEEQDDTEDYLQSQLIEAGNLWSLRTVKITGFSVREPVIVLIQVFLSCCPMLEKLYYQSRYIKSRNAEFKMMSDIMRLPRTSPKAEIICSQPKKPSLWYCTTV